MISALAVVIATCRQESINRWFDAWRKELGGIEIYVVEDNPVKKFILRKGGYSNVWHFAWDDIDLELGLNSWIIPRRTSAIKSYGFYRAWTAGHRYIWTLDDDCFPESGGSEREPYAHMIMKALNDEYSDDSWWNTLSAPVGLYPRGYPYGIRQNSRPVVIHHGLWSGVPDLDGITALEHPRLTLPPHNVVHRVPTGAMFPMCGMNLAFRAEMIPAMYFGLQGRLATYSQSGAFIETKALPYDRFDDIWAGVFAKKVCDHQGWVITSGSPSIVHTKESDPVQRVIKEGPGIAAHETLWRIIADASVPFGLNTVRGSYDFLAGVVDSRSDDLPFPDYWKKLAAAMHIWTELTA